MYVPRGQESWWLLLLLLLLLFIYLSPSPRTRLEVCRCSINICWVNKYILKIFLGYWMVNTIDWLWACPWNFLVSNFFLCKMGLIIIILPYGDGMRLKVNTNPAYLLHFWRKAALSSELRGAVTRHWLSQTLGQSQKAAWEHQSGGQAEGHTPHKTTRRLWSWSLLCQLLSSVKQVSSLPRALAYSLSNQPFFLPFLLWVCNDLALSQVFFFSRGENNNRNTYSFQDTECFYIYHLV